MNAIEAGLENLKNNNDIEFVQILHSSGSTPRGKDAFMIVNVNGYAGGTIGGGTVEKKACEDALNFLKQKSGGMKAYTLTGEERDNIGMICGGSVDVEFSFFSGESGQKELEKFAKKLFEKKPVVWIFGGGHVSLCTADILVNTGFNVSVYDDRQEFACKSRFERASFVICDSFDDIEKNVKLTGGEYILIMTRGHVCDYQVQRWAMKTQAYYIGVIGSQAKTQAVKEKLYKDGFVPTDFDRVYTPVGLQIGAETPEEIAVSIAAEMIYMRAKKENRRKLRGDHSIDRSLAL